MAATTGCLRHVGCLGPLAAVAAQQCPVSTAYRLWLTLLPKSHITPTTCLFILTTFAVEFRPRQLADLQRQRAGTATMTAVLTRMPVLRAAADLLPSIYACICLNMKVIVHATPE